MIGSFEQGDKGADVFVVGVEEDEYVDVELERKVGELTRKIS